MTGNPVVLVVEHQPLLRLSAVDMVEDAGFEAIDTSNAAEAVRMLESRLDVRIVISDIDMPTGMDGLKLAAVVRNRWPPIEIILVSGQVHPSNDELPSRAIFFSKPYREEEVIAAMRKFAA